MLVYPPNVENLVTSDLIGKWIWNSRLHLQTQMQICKKERGLNPGTTEVNGSSEVNDKILLNLMSSIFYMQKSQEAMNSHLYAKLMPLSSALGRSGNMKCSIFYWSGDYESWKTTKYYHETMVWNLSGYYFKFSMLGKILRKLILHHGLSKWSIIQITWSFSTVYLE